VLTSSTTTFKSLTRAKHNFGNPRFEQFTKLKASQSSKPNYKRSFTIAWLLVRC